MSLGCWVGSGEGGSQEGVSGSFRGPAHVPPFKETRIWVSS